MVPPVREGPHADYEAAVCGRWRPRVVVMQVMDVVKLLVIARPWKVDEEPGVKSLCAFDGLTEAAASRMSRGGFQEAAAAGEGAKQSQSAVAGQN